MNIITYNHKYVNFSVIDNLFQVNSIFLFIGLHALLLLSCRVLKFDSSKWSLVVSLEKLHRIAVVRF